MKYHKLKLPNFIFFIAIGWTIMVALSTMTFAQVSGTLPDGLTASTNSNIFTWNVESNKISVTAKPSSSCGTSSQEETLILTSETAASLIVKVTNKTGNGVVKLNDDVVAMGDSHRYELEANGELSIYISSGEDSNGTSLELTITYVVAGTTVNLSFQPVTGTPYKVNDSQVTTTAQSISGNPADGFTVSADDSHYILVGATLEDEAGNKSTLSAIDGKLSPTVSGKVTPIFAYDQDADGIAPFLVGTSTYWDYNSAKEAAGSSGTIILNEDYTLPAGDYEVPSGVTLLIPFDDANTLYTTSPGNNASGNTLVSAGTYTRPTKYRELTMASGANITVKGAISLSAKHHAPNGGGRNAGAPTGPCSFMNMLGGSSITIENGGKLYAWGFITGSGSITAKSGATVYEYFQIQEHRGGTVITDMLNSTVFPFSQYYIQNIEVSLTLEAGASERGYSSLIVSSLLRSADVPFIGSSDCMFNLSSGTLTKKYDGTKDRLCFTINGSCSVSPMELNVGATINSKNFVLPFNGNISVDALEGSNLTLLQDIAILPGAEIFLRKNATCTLGSGVKLYVYDADQWAGYVMNGLKFYSVSYAPGRTYERTEKDMKDAVLQVDGILDASQGYLYTTQGTAVSGSKNSANSITITDRSGGGANICSTGTGKIIMPQIAEGVTIQYDNKLYYYIPVSSAQLKNADSTYCQTGKFVATNENTGNTYTYSNGKWVCETHTYGEGVITPPTCTEQGYTTHTCSVCGSSKVDTYVEALGHSYTSVVTAPTCTEQGYTTHTCSVCGDTKVDTYVDDLGHSYNSVVTAPTCTEQGYTTHTCSVCGDTKVDTYVDALGHSYNMTVTPPTCTAGGSTTYTCTVCGDTYSEETAATGHSYTESVTKQPTCTETGVKTYTCTVCGHSYTEEIPVQSHPVNHATNVELGNSLNMYFAFWGNNITNTTGHYVEVSHTDWKTKETKTLRFEPDLWQATSINVNGTMVQENAYVVYYKDLSAKQMGDTITVTLYDGSNKVVHEWSDSIQNYAMRMLKKYEDDENKGTLRTLIVDMLNYGAACQTESGYNADHLVNAGLSTEQKSWATDDITIEDKSTPNNYHNSSNLVLTGNIQFVVAFNNSSAISKIEYTFANHWNDGENGEAVTREETYYNEGPFINKYLVVADARQMIAITVYDKESTELGTWNDSVESYCARIISNTDATEAQKAVCTAFMKFSDAAEAYLEGGNRV